MPQTPHGHTHFTGTATVRDIVIGMSDGLTVPFALAAGLSGAVDATKIVITAGLAEVAAGAIAMGLGGYLAAKTDAEHYATERATEELATIEMPEQEAEEVAQVFRSYGLNEATVGSRYNIMARPGLVRSPLNRCQLSQERIPGFLILPKGLAFPVPRRTITHGVVG